MERGENLYKLLTYWAIEMVKSAFSSSLTIFPTFLTRESWLVQVKYKLPSSAGIGDFTGMDDCGGQARGFYPRIGGNRISLGKFWKPGNGISIHQWKIGENISSVFARNVQKRSGDTMRPAPRGIARSIEGQIRPWRTFNSISQNISVVQTVDH